jgi:hypothetical protein
VVTGWLLLSANRSAYAEPLPVADQNRIVDLVVVGGEDKLAALRESLGPHELGSARIRWSRASRVDVSDVLRAQGGPVAVRCFIDLSLLPQARLYFADRSAQHFLARDLDLGRGLDDLGKEELGQIIASSIEVLLDNAASGMDREQMSSVLAERPHPPTAAASDAGAKEITLAPKETARVVVGWGVFYSVEAFSREIALSQGPGLFGTIDTPYRKSRLSIRWSAQYVLPQQLEGPLIGARFDTISLRVGAGIGHDAGERARLGVWLGGGLDVVYIDPRQGSAEGAVLSSARYSQTTVATAVVETSVRVSRDLSLTGALFADTDLRPRHYDLTTPGGVATVLEPWRVRPGILLGVATWR